MIVATVVLDKIYTAMMQILYSFPMDKPVNSEVASFCFPHGVHPVLLERTPSMSSLNEIIYGQQFLHSDTSSFVFLMKVKGMAKTTISIPLAFIVRTPPFCLKADV